MGHPGGQGECEACRLGKQTRQPFSKQRERTKIVGEEISADVVGPISPVSLGGSRYFLTIVDTASRYAWIRILKAKSQDSNYSEHPPEQRDGGKDEPHNHGKGSNNQNRRRICGGRNLNWRKSDRWDQVFCIVSTISRELGNWTQGVRREF